MAAERFIDNVDRLACDNRDGHAALDADIAPIRELKPARARAHRQVPPPLRRRLMVRALERHGRAAA